MRPAMPQPPRMPTMPTFNSSNPPLRAPAFQPSPPGPYSAQPPLPANNDPKYASHHSVMPTFQQQNSAAQQPQLHAPSFQPTAPGSYVNAPPPHAPSNQPFQANQTFAPHNFHSNGPSYGNGYPSQDKPLPSYVNGASAYQSGSAYPGQYQPSPAVPPAYNPSPSFSTHGNQSAHVNQTQFTNSNGNLPTGQGFPPSMPPSLPGGPSQHLRPSPIPAPSPAGNVGNYGHFSAVQPGFPPQSSGGMGYVNGAMRPEIPNQTRYPSQHTEAGPGMMNMPPPSGPRFPGSMPPPPGPGGAPLGQDGRPIAYSPGGRQEPPKLTNEILPSVIDVLERDRQFNGGVYECRLNPMLPPLVSTACRTVDCGNSVPEMLRSSLYIAPCTANLLKDSGIPFVLHVQPMAELAVDAPPIPIVYHGEKGPVRCMRCKAYMSPYMKFVEGGKKFQCPFCMVSTEVPQDYFAYLDSEGRRVDVMQRAELCLGTYEFIATKEYCRNEKLPSPPAFIFMIDVSYRAISSGMVAQLCQMLRDELQTLLPVEASGQESKLRVGIATFSDSVHFFNLKAGLKQPSMMTVNDFSDMFVPLVDGFLVNLDESAQMVDKLLEEIPKIFANARQVDTILYPVIQAGMNALEAAGCAGKLFVFNFSLPVFEAPGKLKNRDNRDILGTDKEKTLLKPQVPDYTELSKQCVAVGCSVDLFLFPNSYIDVATLSEVTRLTGGQIYKYAYFTADKDGHRFLWDLRRNLKRNIALDAVLRVRTSAGIRPTDYFGNMSMPTTTEVNLASVDSDKVILAEIKHDDKLEEKTVVHFQVALLYTSLSAQRRVRVLNMALMTSNEYPEIFRTAEIDVIINFMMKNSVKGLYEFSPAAIREGLTERSTKMLAAYRNHCSNKNVAGQLVLPETLKLLPLYTGCLIRNDIISGLGSEVAADDRSWLINHVNSLSVEHSTAFLYPRLFVLNEPVDGASVEGSHSEHTFQQIRSSCQGMRTDRAYLLENGVAMFMWLGSQVDPVWLEDVFGVANVANIDIEKGDGALSTRNSPSADELRRFITLTRNSRPVFMRLMITRQGDKMESWFRRFLVEDQGATSFQQSYVQYIYYLHNAIRDEVEK